MCTCVCFAARTLLTVWKLLHLALHGQGHALTRNPLQSPPKKGHFQHQCGRGWKRKQQVGVRGFLCLQKALSEKVDHIFHTFTLLGCSGFNCTNLDATLRGPAHNQWALSVTSAGTWVQKKRGRWKPFGFLCLQEALMLTSNPGQSYETMIDLSCNLSGTCNIHNYSPESFACCLGFRFPRLPDSGEVLGTPKAGVTPPSPPPQCFVSYASCVVTYCQSVTVRVCFLGLSEWKTQISSKSTWRSCCHTESSWSAHSQKATLRH